MLFAATAVRARDILYCDFPVASHHREGLQFMARPDCRTCRAAGQKMVLRLVFHSGQNEKFSDRTATEGNFLWCHCLITSSIFRRHM